MTAQPLTQWTCDTCGEPVVAEEDAPRGGYVNWGVNAPPIIVHKFGCQRDELSASAALSDFLGPDGLAYLTGMMSVGLLRSHRGHRTPTGHFEFPDHVDEFVDFFRRVQIPGYEEARPALRSSRVWEDWNDSSEVSPYLQKNLSRIAGTE